MTTETGAGQWGSALALACNYFGLECRVYMVKASYYPETIPSFYDADMGSTMYSQPQYSNQFRPQGSGTGPVQPGKSGNRYQ